MYLPKIYIDAANIFKYCATKLKRLQAKGQVLNWGGREIKNTVSEIVFINPNNRIANNEKLKYEAGLLAQVANLAKNEKISLVVNVESLIESCRLPGLDSQDGVFYNAPYQLVSAPIKYSRIIVGSFNSKEEQIIFLSNINHKRFKEIQKATGAYQGKQNPLNENQLLDAWHLWCAEYNNCDYLLTLDNSLARLIENSKSWQGSVEVVTPSKLISSINNIGLRSSQK